MLKNLFYIIPYFPLTLIFLTGYGPPDWGKVSKYCDYTAQSPINIETPVKKDASLKGLSFTTKNRNGRVSGDIKNNGHAPTLTIDKRKGKARLTGGPLGDSVYMLQQFHFHFGCDYDEGSEHLVNGKAYPGEVRNSSSRNFLFSIRNPGGRR